MQSVGFRLKQKTSIYSARCFLFEIRTRTEVVSTNIGVKSPSRRKENPSHFLPIDIDKIEVIP